MIDWASLSPEEFERFCAELLELNGFENIEWYGKGGGDKGRDIVAEKFDVPLPGVRRARKWVVQCKRYTQKNLGKESLGAFLQAAREHQADVALIVTTATLTPDVRDWLKAVQSEYRFEIFVWESRDLERQIAQHRSTLTTVPQIVPHSKEPTWFYPTETVGKVYMGGNIGWEFEEVGFYLLNSYGPKRDMEILQAFIEFLRHNDVRFDDEDESSE